MTAKVGITTRQRAVLALARAFLTARHPLLVIRFFRRLGYLPNPAAPTRYHERMLWRKIVDHNPLFVTLSDKLAAKDYIRDVCPEVSPARTLWSGRDPDDIPTDLVNGSVVVKTNHGCDMNIFVADGRPGRDEIVRKTKRWLKRRFGTRYGEWAYWLIERKVFVEEMLPLSGGRIATEIKVQVCSGVVCHVRAEDKKALRSRLFDPQGNPLPGRDLDYPREDQALDVTPRLTEYIRQAALIAPRIAGDLDYARIDFLVTDEQLYAGEITVYTAAGYAVWSNPAIMADIERLWRLDRSHYLRHPHRGIARLYADALRAKLKRDAQIADAMGRTKLRPEEAPAVALDTLS